MVGKWIDGLRRLLFNDEPVKGCGTGKFIIDAPEYKDLCIEHDDNWNIATSVWEIIGYDLRFAFQIRWRALGFILKAVEGFLFGILVLVFSPLVYLLQKLWEMKQ